jgi:hypothetical protein
MSIFLLAVAAILGLSAETAMANPALVRQRTQIASSQIDIRGSDQIRNRRQLAAGDGEYLGTTIGAYATHPSVWDQEPETINQGTEP